MKKIFLISMLLILLVVTPGDMFTHAQDASIFPANAPQEQMSLRDSLIRPAPVNNLVASAGEDPGSIILTWDASGADGYEGTASAYIIRRYSEPITEDNWDSATTLPNPPTPQPVGSQEVMTISGLVPGQGYHFALKSQNDIPNTSYVSNTAYSPAGRVHYDYATYIPFVVHSTSTETVIISDNTRVLSESTTQYLSEISEDGTLFTFSQSVPELLALQPGDIIVGDVAANAPDGFLRTVTSISTSGSQVVVNTTDATLEEVILEGSMSASGDLVPEDTRSIDLAPGVSMVPQDQGRADETKDWRFDLDKVLYSDEYGEFKIRGHLEIDLGYKFDYTFSWGLKELSFIVYDHREVELYVEGDYSRTLEKKVEIAKVYFTPITFTIGPVPVVLSPQLEIYVGVDGEVKAHFVTGVQAEFSYTAGAEWQKGEGWSIIDRGPTTTFNYTPPQLDLEASLRAYAGIQATLKLYGCVGPYVGLEGYLEFLADVNANPWWDLHVGFDVFAGIELKILKIIEYDHRWTLLEYHHLLAQAPVNRPPFVPSNPTPTEGAAHVSRSILLEWSGGDPDNDPVTYDVYFQQGTSPPSMRVCEGITTTTCKPCDQTPCQADDVLKDGTYYSWKVVATDRFGLTTEGPVWGFTTISPPSEPSNPNPTDFDTGVNRSISLFWSGGDSNNDSVTYDVYFQEGASSPSIRICEGITATICKPCYQIPCQDDDVLKENTHYFWKVVARRFGLTTEGPVWRFTTGTEDEIPETITYSGYVSSWYPLYGLFEGHDYPLYAQLSLGEYIVYSDPFTGYFEIDLPTSQLSYNVTVTSIIGGHDDLSFEFAHGYQDSLDNPIPVRVSPISPIDSICAPGYDWGIIGSDVWGCVPFPGGVVAGYVYDKATGKPVIQAIVSSDDVTVETFNDKKTGDRNSRGLYWLFQPTDDNPQLVEFTAYIKGTTNQDTQNVMVFQSQINRQDFYLGW